MKNKKAELLAPETLKIIVSLICILVLVYLLFSIYNSKKQELLKAKDLVGTISGIINKLRVDPSYVGQPLPLLVPGGWNMISYVGENQKPNQCTGQSCLCVCDSVSTWLSILKSTEERQKNECSKNGVCLIVKDLKDFELIEIGNPSNTANIKISKSDNLIEVSKI